MLSHKCSPLITQGILTTEKIRKYPLLLSNLHVVLKMHAIECYQPYEYKLEKGIETPYYLTDKGLEWFYNFFRNHSFQYLRSLFSQLLIYATPETLEHIEDYPYLSNFRGTDGYHTPAGSKQKAMIIRKVKRCERVYNFDSLKEARDTLRIWLTQYPIEEFTLYRVRTVEGKGTFKEKVPLIVERKGGTFK